METGNYDTFCLGVCITVVGAVITQSGHSLGDPEPPCFVIDHGQNETTASLEISIRTIYNLLSSLKSRSSAIKSELEQTFYVEDQGNASFWNISLFTASTENEKICKNTTLFLGIIRYHYDLLNGLANYFDNIPSVFHKNMNFNLLSALKAVQLEIYNCMCDMKIILRSFYKNPDVHVPGGDISKVYQQLYNGPIAEQVLAEYVVILDSQRIFGFLQPFYSHLITSFSKCFTHGTALIG